MILDWVPAHFPRNMEGLVRFDGSPCFEYEDPRIGEHREWGTYVFDYDKSEVRSFLISNAVFWIHEFHADGIRVDAVSSMIYRNYGRTDFIPNMNGGVENLEAVDFLHQLNSIIREKYPHVMMIAEESTAWEKVTYPVTEGGLGFTHKWNMGWMHDTLNYFETDSYARSGITINSVFRWFTHFPRILFYAFLTTRSFTVRRAFWTKCRVTSGVNLLPCGLFSCI